MQSGRKLRMTEDTALTEINGRQVRFTRAQRVIALVFGVLCHGTFALGIGAMILALYSGLTLCRGRLSGAGAIGANVLLLFQFPIVHSLLLTARGRNWLARMAPRRLGAPLSSTTFALISSLQLLVTFTLWSPSQIVLWEPHGALRIAVTVVFASTWFALMKTMADASLALQTGFLGWGAVVRNRRPQEIRFSQRGTFRYVRQPIYVAFALTLWTGPVWTPDHLAIAIAWTIYCILGPLLKERRYLGFYGKEFRGYQARVPYWLPRLGTASPRGGPNRPPEDGIALPDLSA